MRILLIDLALHLSSRQKHLLAIAAASDYAEYRIACLKKSELLRKASEIGLPVVTLPGASPYNPFLTATLGKRIREYTPNIIHTFGGNAALALKGSMTFSRQASAVIVHTPASQPFEEMTEHDTPKDCLFAQRRFAMVRKLICPSESMMRSLQTDGVPDALLASVPINDWTPLAKPLPIRNGRRFIFLCHADDIPENGLTSLIEALSFLAGRADTPPWELRIIGGYKGTDALLRKAEALHAERNLCLLGVQDFMQQLASADTFISPLTASTDRNPTVLTALSAGIPLICSSVPATLELIGNERNALIYTPGHAAMLASKMLQMMLDVNLRIRLNLSGPSAASAFTLANTAERVNALYADIPLPID